MRNVVHITRRELQAVFLSPLAYLVLTVFLLLNGLWFYVMLEKQTQANMDAMFGVLAWMLLAIIPFLTMRLLSEEYRSGTIESLVTAPVTEAEIILGKFTATLLFLAVMLGATFAYPLILLKLGRPDMGVILSAYAGLFLMGAQFIAVGLCLSALTRSQLLAGASTLVVLLVIWMLNAVGAAVHGPLGEAVKYASTFPHAAVFVSGRIAFRDAFYFLTVTAFWLFLAVRVLESRRWR